MRVSASEKLELIRLVEGSSLSIRRTLTEIGLPHSTFYAWYKRHTNVRCSLNGLPWPSFVTGSLGPQPPMRMCFHEAHQLHDPRLRAESSRTSDSTL